MYHCLSLDFVTMDIIAPEGIPPGILKITRAGQGEIAEVVKGGWGRTSSRPKYPGRDSSFPPPRYASEALSVEGSLIEPALVHEALVGEGEHHCRANIEI